MSTSKMSVEEAVEQLGIMIKLVDDYLVDNYPNVEAAKIVLQELKRLQDKENHG